VVGDRRRLLAWLFLVEGRSLGAFNFTQQYAPLALGLTSRQLSLPGGELASWLTSRTNVPGVVIGVVFLVLLFPDGRMPSRRWWPVGLAGALAVGTWPLRGPALATSGADEPELVLTMFWAAFGAAMVLGASSVVALVLRFRRAGAVQRQQIKWFAFRLWDIDRRVNRTLVYGVLTVLLGAVYAGLVLGLGHLFGGIGGRTPSGAMAAATLAVAALTIERFSARLRDHVDLDSPFGRAAGGGRPHHATDGDLAVAAPVGHRRRPGAAVCPGPSGLGVGHG
jgi:hypothetical protein